MAALDRRGTAILPSPDLALGDERRIQLSVGEERVVEFRLGPDRFTLLDERRRPVVEPGAFEILVGASSMDLRVRGVLEIRARR